MEKDQLISENTPILNDRFIIVETITSSLSPLPTTASLTDQYIKTNFSELVYSKINQFIHELLKQKQVIQMPILYHSNVYYIKEYTESPISNHLLSKNPSYKIVIHYDSTNSPPSNTLYASFSSNEITEKVYTTPLLLHQTNPSYINQSLLKHMFNKTEQIVQTLNTHLSQTTTIQIQKASIEFCCRLNIKNNLDDYMYEPDIAINSIFIKPILNVFDTFTFVSTTDPSQSSSTTIITDPIQIYKAFTNNTTVPIEAYKSKKDVIQEFKQIYDL